MYCCGDCVWPLSPSGRVPLRNSLAGLRADLDELRDGELLQRGAGFADPPRSLRTMPALTWLSVARGFAGAVILDVDLVEALVGLPRRSAGR